MNITPAPSAPDLLRQISKALLMQASFRFHHPFAGEPAQPEVVHECSLFLLVRHLESTFPETNTSSWSMLKP